MSGPYWDVAWNPVTGCTPISPGCRSCWAEAMSRRFAQLTSHECPDCDGSGILGVAVDGREIACERCEGHEDAAGTGRISDFTPTFYPSLLDAPLHWRKPRRVFVANMGDLFHEAITHEQIERVLSVAITAPQHTYLVLTKRPERARRILKWVDSRLAEYRASWAEVHHDGSRIEHTWPLPNVHLGVTVCTQAEADRNIPLLLETPAAVRWVSIEPLLEAVDIRPALWQQQVYQTEDGNLSSRQLLNWVVCGAETGPGARPMQPEWAESVYHQCKAAGVPFFWKSGSRGLTYDAEMTATREYPVVTP